MAYEKSYYPDGPVGESVLGTSTIAYKDGQTYDRPPLQDIGVAVERSYEVEQAGCGNSRVVTVMGLLALSTSGVPRGTIGFTYHRSSESWPPGKAKPLAISRNGGFLSAGSVWNGQQLTGPNIVLPKSFADQTAPPVVCTNHFGILSEYDVLEIDPVGVGYSRATADSQYFWDVRRDTQATMAATDWVLETLDDLDVSERPVVLLAQSAAAFWAIDTGLAWSEQGRHIAGIAFLSGHYDYNMVRYDDQTDDPANVPPFATCIPTMAATHYYHTNRQPTEKQIHDMYWQGVRLAEEYWWTLTRPRLPAARRDNLAKKLSVMTGMSVDLIQENNLRLPPAIFQLHVVPGKIISGAETWLAFDSTTDNVVHDPAVDAWRPTYIDALTSHHRKLGYNPGIEYVSNVLATPNWSFSDRWAARSAIRPMQELYQANPGINAVSVGGFCDLSSPLMRQYCFWGNMRDTTNMRVQYNDPMIRSNTLVVPGANVYGIMAGHATTVYPGGRNHVAYALSRLRMAIG